MSKDAVAVQETSGGYGVKTIKPLVPEGVTPETIPKDWEATSLGEFARISSGGTPSRINADYWNGDIPWVTTTEVDFCTIRQAAQFITIDGLNNSAAKLLFPGTMLIALYGQGKTRGKTAILGIEAATNQACAAIEITRNGVSRDFIFHTLVSMYDSIRSLSNTGNQENLNSSIVRSIPIFLPPENEQCAIANVLNDADFLLEELDSLITKKYDIKQATMQQLLTGQTRLPGFEGEWRVKRLGDLCSMMSGEGITAKSIDSVSAYPCYGGNGLRGYTTRFTHEGSFCLIGRVGALCGNLFQVNGRFFASEHAIVVTSFADVDIGWLTLALGTLRLNQRAESSAQPVLTVSKLLPLEVRVPESEIEQAAIATTLLDMDAEIQAIEKRRHKTAALKQAMTQELLTGRTRLL